MFTKGSRTDKGQYGGLRSSHTSMSEDSDPQGTFSDFSGYDPTRNRSDRNGKKSFTWTRGH